MNTGQMVFELQGSMGEIKEAIASLSRAVEKGNARIEAVERSQGETREALRLLLPKLDDVAGFVRHRAPGLVDKADLPALRSDLMSQIERRPARRQAAFDIAWVVGLIATAVSLGSRFTH
jgi:hypothetical protein